MCALRPSHRLLLTLVRLRLQLAAQGSASCLALLGNRSRLEFAFVFEPPAKAAMQICTSVVGMGGPVVKASEDEAVARIPSRQTRDRGPGGFDDHLAAAVLQDIMRQRKRRVLATTNCALALTVRNITKKSRTPRKLGSRGSG